MLSEEVSSLRVISRLFLLSYNRLTVDIKDLYINISVFILPRYYYEFISLFRFGFSKRLIYMIGYLRDILIFLRLL